MENSRDKLSLIKLALKQTLTEIGRESSIDELERFYTENYGKINFKKYNVQSFLEIVAMFPDMFQIDGIRISFAGALENPHPSPSSKNSFLAQDYAMQQNLSSDPMTQFLTDCADRLKNAGPPKIQLNRYESDVSYESERMPWDLSNLTLEEVKDRFHETNPFLPELLQEYFGEESQANGSKEYDALVDFQEFSNGLNVQIFPGEKNTEASLIDGNDKIQNDENLDLNASRYQTLNNSETSYEDCEGACAFDGNVDVHKVPSNQNDDDDAASKQYSDNFESMCSLEIDQEMLLDCPIMNVDGANYNDIEQRENPRNDPVPFNRDVNAKLPEKLKLNKDAVRNSLLRISNCDSPLLFWFHTREGLLLKEELEAKLKAAYSAFGEDDLKMPREFIKEGMLAYVLNNNFDSWYRARINSVEGNSVHVFFIDYGDCDYVDVEDIKFLLNEFLTYPQLCYRGRVFGALPYSDEGFTGAQCQFFADKVYEVTMKAELRCYDHEQDTYELDLRSFDNDADLTQILFDEKICTPIPAEILRNRGHLLINPVFYLMPSHDMVEKGLFPDLKKIIEYEEKGVDYNYMINSNYYLNTD